jgi:membrane fusion protein (multidrug efflux system)
LLISASFASAEVPGMSVLPLAEQTFETRGVVIAPRQAVLSSEINAQVTRVPFRAGESFKKGERLVSFDCRILEAQRDKVRAERNAAKQKVTSNQTMAKLRSVGKLELAISEAELAQAQAGVRIAQLAVERCRLNAPFDGRVVRTMVSENESIGERQELLEIVDEALREMEIIVPATWLTWIETGARLTVLLDETGEEVQGEVIVPGAVIDPASQSLTLRARLEAGGGQLVPGMSATVRFDGPATAR